MLTVRVAQFLGSCLLQGHNSRQQCLRCNVKTLLQLFETMSQQYCNAVPVLLKQRSLRIVSRNINCPLL